uniref:Glycosyltransferase RgtA/B/C/D-like domain-containing protein n=1 Tax=Prevotella sp. GTC17260 TaxID=3236796 RepID=A0AB33JD86_9BACT
MKSNINLKILPLFALLALLTQYVYGFCISSLFPPIYDCDQGFFEAIGREWANGYIPYLDTWDSKGPIIFFFNMLGYKMGGKSALFWINVINLFLCLTCFYVFLRRRLSAAWTIAGIFLSLFTYVVASEGGNQVSDYSLLLCTLSALVFYHWTEEWEKTDDASHPWHYAAIYGLFFSASLLSRLSNAVWLCLAMLIVAIMLVRQARWRNLGLNALGFILGFAVLFVPFSLYFAYHGAFGEMWYAMFTYNLEYASGTFFEHFTDLKVFINSLFHYAPVWLLLGVSLLNLLFTHSHRKQSISLIIISAGTLFILYKGYSFPQYGLIEIPLTCLSMVGASRVFSINRFTKVSLLTIMIVPCIGFIKYTLVYRGYVLHRKAPFMQILSGLPPSYKVSFVGYNCKPDVYMWLGIHPYYRFFVVQDWAISCGKTLLPKVRSTFREGDVEWILVYDYATCAIKDILDSRYRVIRQDKTNGFLLFKRK